ncbi:MAG TPA: AMP-binding protein [Candidatus Binatus sp.]|jgi:long-chain acyl-CoA synthetase|nr:AMP-binding protein [Candidatus Binatus sp.]
MIDMQASELLKSLPENISDVIRPRAERSPERLAVVEASGSLTYRQLGTVVGETQSWLRELGVRSGDRVLLVCENCRAFVAVFLALTGMDAWPVLANARLSAREIDDIRDHCGARRVIYMAGVPPHAAQHAKRHGAIIEERAGLGSIGVGQLNEKVEPEPIAKNSADRVAALIYTSGTTGLPKGVVLTHRNLLFIAAVSAQIRSLIPDDRLYGVLPMSHAVGLSVVLLGTLLSGATLYLSPRFDPVAALTALERDRLTIVLGVPAMFALLVDYAKAKKLAGPLKFPALRIISSSGAPLQMAVKSAVESLFGMPLHNGYGVTECSPTIAQARVDEPRSDLSVGRVLPGVEIKLVDSDGQNVGDGEVGELWVRGPNVTKGYYRAPEETAAAINSEGWFNTRDLARVEGGHLFIVGRTKELIVRFGMNVYPAEIEAVLNTHAAVVNSAVIGRAVQGAEGGEEVIAFVQLSPGSSISAAELAEHAARNLAPYKRPSGILLVRELPLTPTGKVRKEELSKIAASPAPESGAR